MEGYGWILTIIVGGIAGLIAEKVMNFNTGLILNIVLGIVGAVVVNLLLWKLFGVDLSANIIVQLIAAIIGACILIWGYRAVKGNTA
jgi:uncharacterized membrane protein YeaQ/YmgE (transglycosylase-associated protein family)